MGRSVYINIKELIQVRAPQPEPLRGPQMDDVPRIKDAFLIIENQVVVDFGSMQNLSLQEFNSNEIIDVRGKYILPAFCDAHTHTVFATSREEEFVDKIMGLSYQEIAEKGGGILNSAKKISEISEDELFSKAYHRLTKQINLGLGAIEIKSGYGLSLEEELKMLRVIKKLKAAVDIPIKSTFLGLHAIPLAYKNNKASFVKEVVESWLPKVLQEGLADYVDIFCETNYFDCNDLIQLSNAIKNTPVKLKVHVNQFTTFGGVSEAVNQNALTVDHLEELNETDLLSLAKSNTIATLLPSCSFYLGIPFAPAKTLLNNGVAIALSSDYNPGSSPSYNLFFVWALACVKMKLTPEQAFNALTINAAHAMELGKSHGSIFKGYQGKLILTNEIPSFAYIPYAYGENHVDKILN